MLEYGVLSFINGHQNNNLPLIICRTTICSQQSPSPPGSDACSLQNMTIGIPSRSKTLQPAPARTSESAPRNLPGLQDLMPAILRIGETQTPLAPRPASSSQVLGICSQQPPRPPAGQPAPARASESAPSSLPGFQDPMPAVFRIGPWVSPQSHLALWPASCCQDLRIYCKQSPMPPESDACSL